MNDCYLQIKLNHKYLDLPRNSRCITIQELESFIESKLQKKQNKVKNLIETTEYQAIRIHIENILVYHNSENWLISKKRCNVIKIQFQFKLYNTDSFVIPEHQNILFHFNYCKFNTLDYSDSDIQQLGSQELANNTIQLLIFPRKMKQLALNQLNLNTIVSVTFTNNEVESIIIQSNIPQFIYIKYHHINKEILDFSQFSKLKVLHLDNISQDILLPDCLKSVNISSKSQKFQVLNKTIYADDIQFRNLTLLGKTFPEHSKIHLLSCCIDYILIDDMKYQINIDNNSSLVIKQFINIKCVSDIDQIQFLDKTVRSIELLQATKIFYIESVDIEINNCSILEKQLQFVDNYIQPSHNERNQNNDILSLQQMPSQEESDISSQPNIVDLQFLTQLKSIKSPYFQVQFPIWIQQIEIVDSSQPFNQLEQNQGLVIDYSKLTQLQSVVISDNRIKSLIMFNGQLQFNLNQTDNTSIKISIKPNSVKMSSIKNDLITKVSQLEVSGLENIMIYSQVQELHDFSKFSSLQKLTLQNIDKKIIFPLCIEQIIVKSSSKQDFDLRDYKYLRTVELDTCQITNLITLKPIKLQNCTINYFKEQYFQKKIYLMQTSSINFYQLTNNPRSLKISDINIQTLKLHRIENLVEIRLQGTNTIKIDNNQYTQGIIDFTLFPSLEIIYLQKVNCTKIKFGVKQRKITVQKVKNKYTHLDFSLCQHAKCQVLECNIGVISTSSKVKLHNSYIKLICVCYEMADQELQKIITEYTCYCKYISKCSSKFNLRFLYKLHEYYNDRQKTPYVACLMLRPEFIWVNKIEYIYSKINQLIYE